MASRGDRSILCELSSREEREELRATMAEWDISVAQFLRKCVRERDLIGPILGFGPRDEKAAA
jgi:hypothetical protein